MTDYLFNDNSNGQHKDPVTEKLWDRLYGLITLHKDNLVLFIPVLLGFGIGAYFSLSYEPSTVYAIFGMIITIVFLGFTRSYKSENTMAAVCHVFLLAVFFVGLGFNAAQYRVNNVAAPVLEDEIRITDIQGIIEDIETLEQGKAYRLMIADPVIENIDDAQMPVRIRVKFRDIGNASTGDLVSFKAGLNPPSPPVIPGGFDFQFYSYFKQIGAFGFSYGAPEVIEARKPQSFTSSVSSVRQNIRHRINKAGFDGASSSVLTTLMTGEKSVIAKDDIEAMRKSGLAHILAISGLHVGMVAAFLFFVFRLMMASSETLAIHHPIKKYAGVLAILGAAAYVVIVGAGVPSIRALLMTSIVFFAIIIDRSPISMRLVAVAATCVLLLMPEELLSASFQMSFAAVASLIYFYHVTRSFWLEQYRRSGAMRKINIYLMALMATTTVASVATAPFILFHFQQLPLHNSLLSNLIAMPLMSVIIMPCIVLSYVLMPLSLEFLPLAAASRATSIVIDVAHDLSDWKGAVWTPSAMPLSALILITLGSLGFMIIKGRMRSGALMLIGCAVIIIISAPKPDILISSSGRVVALNDPQTQNLWLSGRRADRFTSDEWSNNLGYGEDGYKTWKNFEGDYVQKTKAMPQIEQLKCDEYGCLVSMNGQYVSVSTHPAGLEEDCSNSDVLIADYPVEDYGCNADIVIDRFDLYYEGVHALYLDKANDNSGSVFIDTVSSRRGKRPWVSSHTR